MPDNGTPNLLIHEKSPYLLQHAHNPVAWRPWGMEAFDLARAEDKPVFVSIGYATCHWCHVMEHESFVNPDVAAFLNEHFISIKVDREERPDVDSIYMDVCQAMTGHGGWPLTVFMDADKRPFVAGTYFPPRTRGGRIGFLDLLDRIHTAWTHDRDRITASAQEIITSLQEGARTSFYGEIPDTVFDIVADHHSRTFDEDHGGFGSQPKFPSPHHLLLLFRIARRTGNTNLIRMATTTLDAMRAGGLFDHVGFGFHRYSTDRRWLLPHFEKMLYDQATLMMAYTEAWQITGAERFRTTCLEIADYLRRDMTSPDGAFYSAQDADSEGEEGKYYVWSTSELSDVLAPSQLELVRTFFNVHDDGNFHDEATGSMTGANILHLQRNVLASGAVPQEWEPIRQHLLMIRGERIPPLTDDKVLTDWNGLMIGALARAGRAFHDATLTSMAVKAYHAVVECCGGTSWVHRYRDGHRHVDAMLDDHAMIGWAAAELYQTTGDQQYLEDARWHATTILETFKTEDGVLAMTSAQATDLPLRPTSAFDSAAPSGNSMAAWLFAQLGTLCDEQRYRDAARDAVTSYGSHMERFAPGYCLALSVWDLIAHGSTEIVLNGSSSDPLISDAFQALAESFLPSALFMWDPKRSPFDQAPRPSVMICTNYHCERPATHIDDVRDWLVKGGGS